MTRGIKIGIILLGVVILIGFIFFTANFNIFGEPKEKTLKTECDYEGLREIKMTEVEGNATTNNSIHIYATDCNYDKNNDSELIFIASASFMTQKDVDFKWKNFDTLTIKYNSKLDLFLQKTESESIKPIIIIEYKTE